MEIKSFNEDPHLAGTDGVQERGVEEPTLPVLGTREILFQDRKREML